MAAVGEFFIALSLATALGGCISIVTTFPSWIAGRTKGARVTGTRYMLLVRTRRRRWVVWSFASVAALSGIGLLFRDQAEGLAIVAAGSILAHYAAFFIGHGKSARSRLRPDPPLEANAPNATVPFAPAPRHETDVVTDVDADLRYAQEEGYNIARPIDSE